jgi:hypothetical protein
MKKKPTRSLERTDKGNGQLRRIIGEVVEFNQKLQTELIVAMSDESCSEKRPAKRPRLEDQNTGGGAGYVSTGHVTRVSLSRAARPRSSKESGSTKTVTHHSKKPF